MMHLRPEDLIDALDDGLAPASRQHLESCVECRARVLELAQTVETVRVDAGPEPSPLFWPHLAARVRAAIGAEPVQEPRLSWRSWPMLLPLAGLAVLIAALAGAIASRSEAPESPGPATILTQGLGDGPAVIDVVASADAGWDVLVTLLGPLDLDTAQQAGLVAGPGAAERVALHLSADERQTLLRLLQEEVSRGGG
ncbi:MAG: anti-sigma factor family protein [Acidobacteriota bacterium]